LNVSGDQFINVFYLASLSSLNLLSYCVNALSIKTHTYDLIKKIVDYIQSNLKLSVLWYKGEWHPFPSRSLSGCCRI